MNPIQKIGILLEGGFVSEALTFTGKLTIGISSPFLVEEPCLRKALASVVSNVDRDYQVEYHLLHFILGYTA